MHKVNRKIPTAVMKFTWKARSAVEDEGVVVGTLLERAVVVSLVEGVVVGSPVEGVVVGLLV